MSSKLVKRRRRRNPDAGPEWTWLFAGFGLGGVAGAGYALLGPGYADPKPTDVGYQTLAGGGAGMVLTGILGGIVKGSLSTSTMGLIVGGAVAVAGYYAHLQQPAIAIV